MIDGLRRGVGDIKIVQRIDREACGLGERKRQRCGCTGRGNLRDSARGGVGYVNKSTRIDGDRARLESLLAIKRAGADLIITYYAERMATLLEA